MNGQGDELAVGIVIEERYELLSLLGRGGYGIVYKARQLNTGQLVAIKVLLVKRADGSREAVEVARFRREMKLVGQIRDPHIVRLIDSGQLEDGRLYLALEYVDGETLADRIKREPIPVREAYRLLHHVLEALHSAHRAGVVHRDLKPHNVMVTNPGARCSAMVLDFGVAFVAEEARDADYRTLTAGDEVAGTPGYMAPEQLISGDVSPGVDIYAWGLVALEALTGLPAVTETSLVKLVLRYSAADPIEIPECLLLSPLGRVLAKSTAVDPEQRYTSAEEALADFEAIDLRKLDVEGLEAELRALSSRRLAAAESGTVELAWGPTIDSAPVAAEERDESGASAARRESSGGEVRTQLRDVPSKRRPTSKTANPFPLDGPPTSHEFQRPNAEPTPVSPRRVSGSGEQLISGTQSAPGAGRERRLLLGAAAAIVLLLAVLVVLQLRGDSTDEATSARQAGPVAEAAQPSAPPPGAGAAAELAAAANVPYMGMVPVPAGTFVMGCTVAADPNCGDDAQPAHPVELDAFEIDVTEVTVAAYAACLEQGVCAVPVAYERGRRPTCNWGHPDRFAHPVNCVTWYQAQLYCEWIGKRLPTEAEWERAARGDDGRRYPWGSAAPSCELATIVDPASDCVPSTTSPVASTPAGASPYGVHDMSGNVHEWTADWYEYHFYASSPTRNPTGPPGGDERARRGGGFDDDAEEVRITRRAADRSWEYDDDIGFRCARSN